MRRIKWTVFITLTAGLALAADLTPTQVQALKQSTSDLAQSRTALVGALDSSKGRCTSLSDAIARSAATRQKIVDEKVALLRTVPGASTLLAPATAMQASLKALVGLSSTINSASAERTRQIQAFSRDMETAVAEIVKLQQQLEQQPSQTAALMPRLSAAVSALSNLQEAAQGISKVSGDVAAQALQQVKQISQQAVLARSEFSKLKRETLGADADRVKGMIDSMDEVNQSLTLDLQSAMSALAQAEQALSQQLIAYSKVRQAIIGSLKI